MLKFQKQYFIRGTSVYLTKRPAATFSWYACILLGSNASPENTVLSTPFPSCVVGLSGCVSPGVHTPLRVQRNHGYNWRIPLAADGTARHALIWSKGRSPDSCMYFVIIAHSLKKHTHKDSAGHSNLCINCIADLRPGLV